MTIIKRIPKDALLFGGIAAWGLRDEPSQSMRDIGLKVHSQPPRSQL